MMIVTTTPYSRWHSDLPSFKFFLCVKIEFAKVYLIPIFSFIFRSPYPILPSTLHPRFFALVYFCFYLSFFVPHYLSLTLPFFPFTPSHSVQLVSHFYRFLLLQNTSPWLILYQSLDIHSLHLLFLYSFLSVSSPLCS